MSNGNNQNNGKNNNQPIQNPFDPKQLVNGLKDANITLPLYGAAFRITCEQLEQQVELMYQNSLGFPELNHVLIYPDLDRSGKACDMKVIFYFNTEIEGSNIVRNGNPNGGGTKTILDFVPVKGVNGEFSVNERFTEVMSLVAVLDENQNIPIKAVRNPKIACIEVDFFLLMAVCLNIDEDDPYNFRIMTVNAGNRGNDGYENATITILKYIDNNRRYSRNRGKGGSKIDYRAMDREFIRGTNPGSGDRNY